MRKFENFLARASQCRTLLGTPPQSSSSAGLSRSDQDSKQIILLEDLPNILHEPTQSSLHAVLESFLESPPGVPLVIIISEASTRGEFRDERIAENGGGSSSRDNVDIRTVLPSTMINGPFVRQIQYVDCFISQSCRNKCVQIQSYRSDINATCTASLIDQACRKRPFKGCTGVKRRADYGR